MRLCYYFDMNEQVEHIEILPALPVEEPALPGLPEAQVAQMAVVEAPPEVIDIGGTLVKLAPYNPREISRHDFAALKRSISEFGDLSGIVLNRQTGNLVGGHQRIRAFQALHNPSVVIEEELPSPNSMGTIARGYVLLGDEKYTYRVVDWELQWEMAANVAANRIQGTFDKEKLASVIEAMEADLHSLTGNTVAEIEALLQLSSSPEINLPTGDKNGFQQMTFTISDEQAEIINAATAHCQATHDFTAEANQNSNGNALFFIAQEWLNEHS